jgi:hypothetical protein
LYSVANIGGFIADLSDMTCYRSTVEAVLKIFEELDIHTFTQCTIST